MKKLAIPIALIASLPLVALAATSGDFHTDVANGLRQQQANAGIQQARTSVEAGESRAAGDENNQNIKEQDVEKEIEAEIETESSKSSGSTDNSTSSGDGSSSTSTNTSKDSGN